MVYKCYSKTSGRSVGTCGSAGWSLKCFEDPDRRFPWKLHIVLVDDELITTFFSISYKRHEKTVVAFDPGLNLAGVPVLCPRERSLRVHPVALVQVQHFGDCTVQRISVFSLHSLGGYFP